MKGFAQCIRISANRFRSALPQGHMTGHDIHNNVVEDCFVGINLIVTAQAAIHDNIIRRTFIGVNLNADSEVDVHHNTFSQNGQDIVLDDPDLGPGNTEFKNVTDPGLAC